MSLFNSFFGWGSTAKPTNSKVYVTNDKIDQAMEIYEPNQGYNASINTVRDNNAHDNELYITNDKIDEAMELNEPNQESNYSDNDDNDDNDSDDHDNYDNDKKSCQLTID